MMAAVVRWAIQLLWRLNVGGAGAVRNEAVLSYWHLLIVIQFGGNLDKILSRLIKILPNNSPKVLRHVESYPRMSQRNLSLDDTHTYQSMSRVPNLNELGKEAEWIAGTCKRFLQGLGVV